MKTLWFVSGGAETVPGILRAREMGLHVVVSDGSPDAPGFEHADDTVLASTYDIDQTLHAARSYHRGKRPINGITCVAADVPLTVATVAADLGLPGIPVEAARLASDKLAMKECFQSRGIPIPWFAPVKSARELKGMAATRGLPLIVKPVDSRGARGVLRLTKDVDLQWAFEHARSFSPTGRVMVEEFLEGPQVSTETILLGGTGFTPGFADRNYQLVERFAPFIIEDGGEQPSHLAEGDRAAVRGCAEAAGRALGIRTGVAKGDMVLTAQGPKVIEIAARLSGGWFSTDQVPLGTGVDLVGAVIKLALGEQVESANLVPKTEKGVAIRYFFPEPGRVKSIHGIREARELSWVHRLGLFVREGDVVQEPTNHTRRAGFVITVGGDRHQAVERAEQVVATVEIKTQAT